MALTALERRMLWSALAITIAFTTLGVLVFQFQALVNLDRALSAAMLGWRHPVLDSIMVAITMAADSRVLTLFAITMVLLLLVLRAWGLALFCAASMLANVFLVPGIKGMFQRARPMPLSTGADSFSFPSGHAAMATVVLGTAVLLVASGLGRAAQKCAIAVLATVLGVVAVSRVYLQVHWVSDVVAGVMLGAITLFVLRIVLERCEVPLPSTVLALLLFSAFLMTYLIYLFSTYSLVLTFYFPG